IDFGRGVLEALGSNYPLGAGELAARGNFCTLDPEGVVTDRRADRPSDEECQRLCTLLEANLSVDGVQCQFLPGKQHRFTLILQGEGLGAHLNDNDPQVEGKKTLPFEGRNPESERTAARVTEIFDQARTLLAEESQATGVLLRGFSARPDLDTFDVRYGLRAAAIAIYPMYSGVARLVGMEVLDPGKDLDAQIAVAKEHWDDYDFFFIHTKATDQAGHSGDFDAKVEALEEIDRSIPALRDLGAAVTVITGDHSTPSVHLEHSWHSVPTLIESGLTIPVPEVTFNERGVLKGDLGTFSAQDLLPLCLAHAGRLDKFGA
ncbi:MAG: phosphoglycerate mutase, partial [Planctomycetota bacterium]